MKLKRWLKGDGSYPYAYAGGRVVTMRRPILGLRRGVHWAHAAPGGGPILKAEVSWLTISGVVVNTDRGAIWLYFRRGGV